MTKIKPILISLGVIFTLSILVNPYFDYYQGYNYEEPKNEIVKNSDYWVLSPIFIDDEGFGDYTWAQAASQSWCNGSGTWSDPYILENITINGGGTTHSCLTIQRSTKHFIVRNCTFTNSGGGVLGGIKLWETDNGILFNNTCINNIGNGIRLEHSDNNTISHIISYYNSNGISLYVSCLNNRIYNCKIRYNGNGISLNSGCDYNEIKNNIIINNTVNDGILLAYCDYNIFYNNTMIRSGNNGIELSGSYNNVIQTNTFFNNTGNGIYLFSSQHNNVTANRVYNNSKNGIELSKNSRFNQIFENEIFNNLQRGAYIEKYAGGHSIHNYFYNNSFIGNGENARDLGGSFDVRYNNWNYSTSGNYWDDYLGVDSNDDGIGDTPYDIIALYSGCKDSWPIWRDGPEINIITPLPNEYFRATTPSFNISLNELYVNSSWYTIDEGKINITFSGLTGKINQTEWDKKADGSVFIKFYANDSWGIIRYSEVEVQKDISEPLIFIDLPTPNQLCGITAPTFNIQIIEANLQEKRYSLNGRPNITFTTETQFNQTEWNQVGNGTVSITFYIIDKAGNVNSSEIIVRKDAYVPDIIINFPLDDDQFGKVAPNYNISIIEEDLVSTWYTIEGIAGTFPFTGLTGVINQDAWDDVPEGGITITFYALDSAGNMGSESVVVIKSVPSEPAPVIPGYNVLLMLSTLAVVSILISKKVKKN